jgi:hypothetical protein
MAVIATSKFAALCMNGHFYRCGAAKNFGVRIAAFASISTEVLPDWARSRLSAMQRSIVCH